jgi:glycosyltransferase involved in cell wall biosynthesis
LNLEGSVTIRSEYLPNDKVALYFSAADAVILPYLSATQSGIAQIAFNFDRPVIATTVGGLGEVVRDNITGLLAPPADPLALRDKIASFYVDVREPSLTKGVRAEKGRYSWENLVRAIEELTHSRR